jgi:signal transduction histidine kinase
MGVGNLSLIESVPGARRLVSSLRDLGYDFVQAVADVVDNSIAAGATKVAITLKFSGPDSWVRIADNGKGMSGPELTEPCATARNELTTGWTWGNLASG